VKTSDFSQQERTEVQSSSPSFIGNISVSPVRRVT